MNEILKNYTKSIEKYKLENKLFNNTAKYKYINKQQKKLENTN